MADIKLQSLKEANDLSLVGGKALSLGQLLRSGIKTAAGFVVTTVALGQMNKDLEQQILKAFDELKAEYVAVRSSAVAEDSKDSAWAGQLDTFLGVNRDEVLSYISRCWASTESKRARAYAKQKGLRAGAIAVIIQAMIPSEISGIAFSINPVNKNINEMIIEAGLGLNEPIVSGQITPDTFVLDKKSGFVLQKHISNQVNKLIQGSNGKSEWQKAENGSQQKVAPPQIKELISIVLKLEKYFGFPVDVEWTYANGELYILQSRPITTI
jgi:phosphoenolpyruvate synthase/pyruvate phosphate dikinase